MSPSRFDPVKHRRRLESSARYLRQPPELILPYLPASSGKPVVEVGCGTGYFGRIIARYHSHSLYLGLDPSVEMLNDFKASLLPSDGAGMTLVLTERERLPLRSGSVSLLFMADVLHEILIDAGLLSELRRVVAAGGHLLLVDWKKLPSRAGPPVFLKVSRRKAVSIFLELGFRPLAAPPVYRFHYCLLFRKE